MWRDTLPQERKSTPMTSLENIGTVTSYRLSKLYLGIYKYIYIYACATCMSGVQGIQKTTLDLLELGLGVDVSHQVGAGN